MLIRNTIRKSHIFARMLFSSTNQFFWRNLQQRNREEALRRIHNYPHINSVLSTREEVEDCLKNLEKLKIPPHNDRPKNWDCYRAFSFIARHGHKESKVLDVGCADYGVILPWLELYGFRNLVGCDIAFEKNFHKGRIHYSKEDLMNTSFKTSSFDFITSISVIEHGVNEHSYLREMHRLLKPGGYLLTSADYWPEPIDTKDLYPYGEALGEMKIFTEEDIKRLVGIAQEFGLELTDPIDFSYRDKVVSWRRVNRQFTFIFFVLKKMVSNKFEKIGKITSLVDFRHS